MREEYLLNPRIEIVPVAADRYELRLPHWGQAVVATAEEIALLQRFDRWAPPDSSASAFLQRCIDGGVLLARLPSGKPRFPQLVRPQPTMFAAPEHDTNRPAALTFLGAPIGIDARFGPGAIRKATEKCRYTLDPAVLKPRGFYDYASGRTLLEGVTLADAGDVFVMPGEDPQDTYDRVTELVTSLLLLGTRPLVLGGDGSITYSVLRAFSHERLGVIHLDAQTDLGDVQPSGLDHGNVFSFVLDKLEFVERIHQIGLRGVSAAGVRRHDRASWYGIERVRSLGAVMLAEALPADIPYYVSIDIRVVDREGLFPHELKSILRAICSTREIVGVDVVEVGAFETNEGSAVLAMEALLAVADGVRAR